jgi:deazaflavin-dependent oxidoreductase (nitroreductase family)
MVARRSSPATRGGHVLIRCPEAQWPYARRVQLRRNDEANAAQRALRAMVASRPGAWVSRRAVHRIDLFAYRVAPGRMPPSQWLAAVPVGLLTTTGARSGKPHTVPLLLTTLESGWGVIASNYGSGRPPAWYFNLRAHPVASLEVDGVAHRVRAVQVHGGEKERVPEAAQGWYRGYTGYEQRAGGRDLGFFMLHPEHD